MASATALLEALKSAAFRIVDSSFPAVLATLGPSNLTTDADAGMAWSANPPRDRPSSLLWAPAANASDAVNPGSCVGWGNGTGNGSSFANNSTSSPPAIGWSSSPSFPSLTTSLSQAARCGYALRDASSQQGGILAPWQVATLACGVFLLFLARSLSLTVRLRRVLQPLVTRMVERGTATVVSIQRYRHPWLDAFMSLMAMVVSIEFYTAFLPVIFWSGRPYLATLTVLLLAACMYAGNALKDVVAAPRPLSPPAQRVTGTHMDAQSSFEFGLPSSHTINTIALPLYILLFLYLREGVSASVLLPVAAVVAPVVVIVVVGRLYLGMHSPIDLAAGTAIGVTMPLLLLSVDMHILQFWIHGPNVVTFHACLAALLLFAYPTPPHPTPSYEDHNAFTGVVLGLVSSFHLSLRDSGPDYLALPISTATHSPTAIAITIITRVLIGLPLAVIMKEVAGVAAKQLLPPLCRALGLPVHSTRYVKSLHRVASVRRVSSVRRVASSASLGGVGAWSGGGREGGGVGGESVFCDYEEVEPMVVVPWAMVGSSDVGAAAAAAPVTAPAAAAGAAAPAKRSPREEKRSRKRGGMRKSKSEMGFAASGGKKASFSGAATVTKLKAQGWGKGGSDGGAKATAAAPATAATAVARVVSFDVDTGIRLCAYMCLAWSVGGLAPIVFRAIGV